MKTICFFVQAVVLTAALTSCSKEPDLVGGVSPETQKPTAEMMKILEENGFDLALIKIEKDRFRLDTDVVLPFDDLVKHQKYVDSIKAAVSTRATIGNPYLLFATGRTVKNIRIDIESTPLQITWRAAIEEALEEWNAIPNTAIHMEMSSFRPTMVFRSTNRVEGNQVSDIGYAVNASCGRPGANIWLFNREGTSLTVAEKKNAMAHLIGHAIGLGHTEAPHYLIPGTNPNPSSPEKAVMSMKPHPWYGFSSDEILGIQVLYPEHLDQFQVMFNVPDLPSGYPNIDYAYTSLDASHVYRFTPIGLGGMPGYKYTYEYSLDNKKTWSPFFTPVGSNTVHSQVLPSLQKQLDIKVIATDATEAKAEAYTRIIDNDVVFTLDGSRFVKGGEQHTWTVKTSTDQTFDSSKFSWEYAFFDHNKERPRKTDFVPIVLPNPNNGTSVKLVVPKNKSVGLMLTYVRPVDGKVYKRYFLVQNDDLPRRPPFGFDW